MHADPFTRLPASFHTNAVATQHTQGRRGLSTLVSDRASFLLNGRAEADVLRLATLTRRVEDGARVRTNTNADDGL